MIRTSYDPADFDYPMITDFISHSYWGEGRMAVDIRNSIEHSYPVGLFDGNRQIAFARAISDCQFSAYVYDLFVVDEYRGRGLARRLMKDLMAHPDLSAVTGWMLSTRDAQGLYEKLGFVRTEFGRTMHLTKAKCE